MVWCNIPEEMNLQHHCCENLKICSAILSRFTLVHYDIFISHFSCKHSEEEEEEEEEEEDQKYKFGNTSVYI
jgi:hypothetical protein